MRCIRAVKSLRAQEGCETLAIALYTEIDRDAPFVRHADLAIAMPAPRGEDVTIILTQSSFVFILSCCLYLLSL